MQAALTDRPHHCPTCLESIALHFAIFDCCAHAMCEVCAKDWYTSCYNRCASFTCPLCRKKVETWMQSESYLEHDSIEKQERISYRHHEMESIRGEDKSSKILSSFQILNKKIIGLNENHEEMSRRDTIMQRQNLQLNQQPSKSGSLSPYMLSMCTMQLHNHIETFAEDREVFITEHKRMMARMNVIFICPIDANLRQNIEEAVHRIFELLTVVEHLNIEALNILSKQTRYIPIQNNLFSNLES